MQFKANHDWYQRQLAPTGIQLITADHDYCQQNSLPIGAWVQFIKLTIYIRLELFRWKSWCS